MADFNPEAAGVAQGEFDPESLGVNPGPPPAPPAPHDEPQLKAAWQSASSPLEKLKVMLNWSDKKGLDTYMGNARQVAEMPKSMAMNAGGATAGQALGALGGPLAPATVPLGGAIGGFLGNMADQKTRPGDQPFKWGEAFSNAAAGAVPGVSLAKAGGKEIGKAALKYAGTNLGAKAVETEIDEGRLPTVGEALIASGTGAVSAPLSALFDPGSHTAQIAAAKQLNGVRDETLRLARDAGYKIPSSTVNESGVNTVLESLGGKAAVKQEMTLANQEVTNDLAKKPFEKWGLPQNEPLSRGALDDVREKAGQAYERMTALFPDAGPMVYELKEARLQAKYQNNRFYQGNPPGDPEAYMLAQAAQDKADLIESQLEAVAKSANQPKMVDEMREARKTIAQTYQVENALNEATGDVSAKVIGSSYKQGKPLTDELATIGRFYNAFKQFAGDAAATPSPGVGKTKAIAAAVLGSMGGAHGGGPGALAGMALPFADKIPRAIAGSGAYQNSRFGAPFYGTPREDISGMLAKFATQSAGRTNPMLQFLNQQQAQP